MSRKSSASRRRRLRVILNTDQSTISGPVFTRGTYTTYGPEQDPHTWDSWPVKGGMAETGSTPYATKGEWKLRPPLPPTQPNEPQRNVASLLSSIRHERKKNLHLFRINDAMWETRYKRLVELAHEKRERNKILLDGKHTLKQGELE